MRRSFTIFMTLLAAGSANAEPSSLPAALAEQLSPQAGGAGFLLSCGVDKTRYSTLWLEIAPGQATARMMPFVASPQKEGFRYLGSATAPERMIDFKDENGIDWSFSVRLTSIWVGREPAAARAAAEKSLAAEAEAMFAELKSLLKAGRIEDMESLWRSVSIRFVGNGTLSLHRYDGSYAFGAAHPSHGEFWGTYPFTSAKPPAHDAEPLTLTDLLPGTDIKMVAAAQTKALRAGQFIDAPSDDAETAASLAEELAETAIKPEAGNFVLAQRQGRTRVLALAPVAASYAASGDYELLAAAEAGPAPRSVAPYNDFNLSWDAIRRTWPNVQDAFIAPGDRALAVLSEGQLSLYEGASGTRLWHGDFPCDRVVAANWATGKAVARWTAEFDKAQ